MSEDKGYFIVPRDVADMSIWHIKPYSAAQAYVDLWRIANYQPGQIITLRNITVDVQRGQIGWSYARLAEEWGWSTSKVKRFLLRLKSGGQISIQTSNITTLIILKDYCKWDINDSQNGGQATRRRHADDTQTSAINTVKAVNINKQEIDVSLFPPPLKALYEIQDYNFDTLIDGKYLLELVREFPMVDAVSLLKGWRAYLIDNPFKKKANQRAQLRNQFENAKKYGRHKKAPGNGNGDGSGAHSEPEKQPSGYLGPQR